MGVLGQGLPGEVLVAPSARDSATHGEKRTGDLWCQGLALCLWKPPPLCSVVLSCAGEGALARKIWEGGKKPGQAHALPSTRGAMSSPELCEPKHRALGAQPQSARPSPASGPRPGLGTQDGRTASDPTVPSQTTGIPRTPVCPLACTTGIFCCQDALDNTRPLQDRRVLLRVIQECPRVSGCHRAHGAEGVQAGGGGEGTSRLQEAVGSVSGRCMESLTLLDSHSCPWEPRRTLVSNILNPALPPPLCQPHPSLFVALKRRLSSAHMKGPGAGGRRLASSSPLGV